ncbi:MAG: acyl-CoA dehydrogenase [Pseudomonadota bacterium]
MADQGLTFRQRYISRPLLNWVRGILPTMSDTEREALEAGTVWWDAELMRGDPDFSKLLQTPVRELSEEEQAFLDGPTAQLCSMIDDWKITFEDMDIPKEVWDYVKSEGFLGLIIPKEYGGKGFSATANSEIVTRLASRGSSAAITVVVPNSLGPGELLMLFGTQDQKDHWLPRLADGRDIPAFGLTSQDAGSDAASMTDIGVVCYEEVDGKKTLGMRLNWAKRYISLGPICTVLGLAFKLTDPDHILGDEEDLGITLALIPTDTPGVDIGRRHLPGMQAFPNGPNWGKDVFVPMDAIIGGQERIGQGWKMLVTALAAGRGIMLPAMSVSGMKLATHATGAYARIREQFNIPISRFEGIQEAAARIAGDTYKMDAARRLTLQALDIGEKPSVISAIMKYHATEGMRRAITDAMDIHSGKAVIDGPKNYLSSTYRAIPIAIAVEGANIMTRSLMIYGQGSIRCHPFIQKEIDAAQNPDRIEGVRAFDEAVFRHAGYTLKTLALATARAWTFGLVSTAPVGGAASRYYKQVKRLSSALAVVSETAMVTLGGALKRREMISARLGDVISHLYLTTAVLKRFEDTGRPEDDLPLMHYAAQSSLHAAEEALSEVIRNFPVRPIGWLLRGLVLPFGIRCASPKDRLTRKVSNTISEPTAARARLSEGIHIEPDSELDLLTRTFDLMVELEPVKQKMRKARIRSADEAMELGILTDNEAASMKQALSMVREVSRVDDFSLAELTSREPSEASAQNGRNPRRAA